MDWRDSKTQKIVIGVLAFFIVVYFWHSRVYSRYSSQIALKTAEFETITTNLRDVEMKAKSLDALKIEYTELVDRYHEIEALLPEVKAVPSILVQLHTASSLTGTRITKVHPQAIASEEFYNVAAFEVEMIGTYHDVGRFVSYVANFPFIANISDVSMVTQAAVNLNQDQNARLGAEQGSQEVGRKKETVTAHFTLATYFVQEGERLKELTL
jgi:type IV pilus assembly protein PilO